MLFYICLFMLSQLNRLIRKSREQLAMDYTQQEYDLESGLFWATKLNEIVVVPNHEQVRYLEQVKQDYQLEAIIIEK
jgi:hypothetical protein